MVNEQSGKVFTPKSVGILLLSLLTMATGIVSPSLPAISKEYPDVPQSLIDQVSAIPSFAMAVFVIISTWIVKKIGTKKTVELGLWMIIISTVISLIAPNIWVLLGARLLLGAGIGTYNSLAVSLIAVSYSGKLQSKLMGWENAFQGIGALGGSLLVSVLLLVHWRLTFAMYLIAIFILVYYHLHVPDIPLSDDSGNADGSHAADTRTNWLTVTGSGIATFLLMSGYMITVIKLPTYLIDHHIASANTGSILIGLLSLTTIIAGVAYGRLFGALRFHTISVAIALMTIAFGLLGMYPTLLSASISCALIGISFGLFVPFCFSAAAHATSAAKSDDVTTLMIIANNLANFVAPFSASLLLLGSADLQHIFFNGSIVFVIIFAIALVIGFTPLARQRASK